MKFAYDNMEEIARICTETLTISEFEGKRFNNNSPIY